MRRTNERDPRAQRSRAAVLQTFGHLVFEQRYDAIRIADLIARSGTGRTTFYEHFEGKDDVLVAAMEPLLQTLANAALGRTSAVQCRLALEHVWDKRAVARSLLTCTAALRLQRRLATLIEARLPQLEGGAPAIMIATGRAAAQLAMLRLWVSGQASCTAGNLARQMIECSRPLDA